jgi:hypothetical protein
MCVDGIIVFHTPVSFTCNCGITKNNIPHNASFHNLKTKKLSVFYNNRIAAYIAFLPPNAKMMAAK